MQLPNFYSVIPSYIRYDQELTSFEKLIYSEIVALTNYKGYCYAYNKYFEYVFKVSKSTVQRSIKKLEQKEYIKIDILKDKETKQIIERKIYILDMVTPSVKNDITPSVKNDTVTREPNLFNNNTRKNNNYNYNKYSFSNSKPKDVNIDWLDEYIANMPD